MVGGFEDNLYKTTSVSEFLDAFIHSSPLFCFSLKNITLGKYKSFLVPRPSYK